MHQYIGNHNITCIISDYSALPFLKLHASYGAKIMGFSLPSRHFWDCRRWKSGLSINLLSGTVVGENPDHVCWVKNKPPWYILLDYFITRLSFKNLNVWQMVWSKSYQLKCSKRVSFLASYLGPNLKWNGHFCFQYHTYPISLHRKSIPDSI